MPTVHACAKVNLTLEVLGKRPDGYHEIASVMQTIDLADVVCVEHAGTLTFDCADSEIDRPDLLEESLMNTARLLQRESGCRHGARIRVERVRIPRAAGLGSSSADCAAVLRALNDLWSLGFSQQDLCRLASGLGSDTPFFIYGGTALAEGRGERVAPLPTPATSWLVLLIPPVEPIPNKTGKMYGMLGPDSFTSGETTRRAVRELEQGTALPFLTLCNTFEDTAFRFYRDLGSYRERLLGAGAQRVRLAGSGPALFTIVRNEAEGRAMTDRLREEGPNALLAHTL